MDRNLIIFSVMIFLLLSLSFSVAETFSYGRTENIPINYSLIPSVNSSDFWDGLNTPADIDHSLLANLGWSVSGHSIDGDIDMNSNTLTDMDTLLLSGGGYIGDWSDILFSVSNFSPYASMYSDLGSGSNRWKNLWVGNINAENIDAFNLNLTTDLNVGGNVTMNNIYGSMYNHEDNMTTITFATQDVYVNVTNMSISDVGVNGFDYITTNGGEGLVAQINGAYEFDWSISFNGQTGSTHGGSIAVNGIKNEECYARRKLGSADTGNMGSGCHIRLVIGDHATLVMADEDAVLNNINVISGNIKATRIGN